MTNPGRRGGIARTVPRFEIDEIVEAVYGAKYGWRDYCGLRVGRFEHCPPLRVPREGGSRPRRGRS